MTIKARKILINADVIYCPKPSIYSIRQLNENTYEYSRANIASLMDNMLPALNRGRTATLLYGWDFNSYRFLMELTALLDKNNVPYELIPGVTPLQALAAKIGQELTIPHISQSVISTYISEESVFDKGNAVINLSKHEAAMALFFTVKICHNVRDYLLHGYSKDTPIAVMELENENVVRGALADLSDVVSGMGNEVLMLIGKSLTASIKNVENKSSLYDENFTHEFRKSKNND
ncbi:precorrin-4 C11-methyltransferase [Candidatus Magnetoovum chiemensis]|nr:precorrin-4 C11-methyltransferase [Candidatus Magnetoovum chiemensis]